MRRLQLTLYVMGSWNGMQDDGTDKGFNYGTATAAKYINQGETGIDTGGPCFPSHCSSCPDSQQAWCSASNQIIAVSSGSCKGRALQASDANLACAATFPYMYYPLLCPDNSQNSLQSVIATRPPPSGLYTPTVRIVPPTMTTTTQAIDFLDVRTTYLTADIASSSATTISVNSVTALTCANMNLATRDCSTAGTAELLVENYIKVVDINSLTATAKSEIMKVTAVNGNALTVLRGQGSSTATTFTGNANNKLAVFLCGKYPYCIASVVDLSVGRYIKVDDEIMKVKNYAAIGAITAVATACGGAASTATPLTFTCNAPCVYKTPAQAYINTDGGGAITAITITDPGSGYDPNNMPTVANFGTGACALTLWWTSAVVVRGTAATASAAHGATGSANTVTRLNCLDDDETGDNCGGSCKPCAENVKGPQQHRQLICVTPEAPFDAPMQDLEVTVEAAPGPTDSPYQVRMGGSLKRWTDNSARAVSCVSSSSRGFNFGAHDFVWGVHIRSVYGSTHVTAIAVDENNGEVYVLGTMQGTIYLEGKHVMTSSQLGVLYVTPATSANPLTVTCTGAPNLPFDVTGTGNDDCGRSSFFARFSRDGRPIWINMMETKLATTASSVTGQAIITDASFDTTNSELYIVGHYSDGMLKSFQTLSTSTTLTLYDVDPNTRMSAKASSSGTLTATVSATNPYYQEGFMAKYSRAGALRWVKSVGFATAAAIPNAETGLLVSNLQVVAYKAASSKRINTQLTGLGAPPNLPTQTSRKDIEYDRGLAQAAVQGGTGTDSSITLKAASSSTNKWYVGMTIQIVEGAGITQTRTIYEYDGTTKIARVQPHWDPAQTPAAGSRYVILSGRPSSWLSGMHWSNGGVYVSGRLMTICGPTCATTATRGAISVVIGEMQNSYRDANAQTTPKYVQALVGQDDHQNFLAQFDSDGRVFWSRFVGNNGASGTVTSVTSATVFTVASDASTADSFYVGCSVTIVDGTGGGQTRVVSAYTGATRTVTVSAAFTTLLVAGSSRYIIANKGTTGTFAAAGTATSVTLAATPTKNTLNGAYNGATVVITSGTGIGQVSPRRVRSVSASLFPR